MPPGVVIRVRGLGSGAVAALPLRHASAKTTLSCYGHLWPDWDESTRAVDAVLAARAEQIRNGQVLSNCTPGQNREAGYTS
jgi:hypothetical protein